MVGSYSNWACQDNYIYFSFTSADNGCGQILPSSLVEYRDLVTRGDALDYVTSRDQILFAFVIDGKRRACHAALNTKGTMNYVTGDHGVKLSL